MTFLKSVTTTAIMASVAASHMIMQNPKPFGGSDLDNSPLTSSNYPCKLKGDPATFYNTAGLDNTITTGQSMTLSFKGSAVHGGGSCQLALTKDLQPSASTSWQVIESIEGGCPSKSGEGADTYDFKIPDGIGSGNYVFAWTWISKLAGQPEYYMNCAPLTVKSSKRNVSLRRMNNQSSIVSRDSQFPELFVANLADINSCKTTPGTDPQYPDAGSNVVRPGTKNNFAKPQGENCVPKGAKSSGGSSSSNNQSTSVSAPSGFVTSVVAGSSSSAVATQSSSAFPVVSSQPQSNYSSPVSSGPTNSGAGGLTGACTAEGMFNCIGGTSYQQCASGSWSIVMQMPATIKCAEGQTMTLWGRDEMKSE
ncbi:hypothetical protein F4804DRAFT_334103 [Jackrogersella minutella]|nr:hypothetical protein F4804DRAFT_334103 [Jackrogersella minutella]